MITKSNQSLGKKEIVHNIKSVVGFSSKNIDKITVDIIDSIIENLIIKRKISFRFYLLERVQSAIQALKGSDQADALALLDNCNMTAVLDLKLDRRIGRANNLEVWLD